MIVASLRRQRPLPFFWCGVYVYCCLSLVLASTALPTKSGGSLDAQIRVLEGVILRDQGYLEKFQALNQQAGIDKYAKIRAAQDVQLADLLQQQRDAASSPGLNLSIDHFCDPLIPTIATKHFLQSNMSYAPDDAHNAIMHCLLQHAPRELGFSAAYHASMLANLNGQAYLLQSQADADALHETSTASIMVMGGDGVRRRLVSNFLRDAIKVNVPSGYATPTGLPALMLERFQIDDVFPSMFDLRFDAVVSRVNAYINSLNLPPPLPPPAKREWRAVPVFAGVAHRDGLQIVPIEAVPRDPAFLGKSNFLGVLTRQPIRIAQCRVASTNQLQGLFASDGAFAELNLVDNQVSVGGAHTISFNGVLSGLVQGNTDFSLTPLAYPALKFLPLRLGGFANIYILDFHPLSSYQYQDLRGDVQPSSDLRRAASRDTCNQPGSVFYSSFHMDAFHTEFRSISAAIATTSSSTTSTSTSSDAALLAQMMKEGLVQFSKFPLYYHIKLSIDRLVARQQAVLLDRATVCAAF